MSDFSHQTLNDRRQSRAAVRACLSLMIIYGCVLYLIWGSFGDIFVDRGFEFYLPWRMQNGLIPIRDVFLLVPPAAYQINSLIMWLAGDKVSVLLFAGAANGLLFILLLYFILLRVASPALAWGISLSSILVTVFSQSIFNFYFPYCFAMPYASSAFAASLLCLIRFQEISSFRYFLSACFMYGLSITFKHEFAAFGIILCAVAWIKGATRISSLSLGLFCASLAPAISFGALYIRGVSLHDYLEFFAWLRRFVSFPLLSNFYQRVGAYSAHIFLTYYETWLLSFVSFLAVLYAFYLASRLQMPPKRKALLTCIVFCVSLGHPWSGGCEFVWLGFFSGAIFIGALFRALLLRQNICPTALLVGSSLILAGLKTAGSPVLFAYGSIFLPYYWGIIASALSVSRVPVTRRCTSSVQLALLCAIVSIAVSLFTRSVLPTLRSDTRTFAEVASRASPDLALTLGTAGAWKLPLNTAKEIAPILERISKLRSRDSRLWVLPEGTLLNFLLKLPGQQGFHNLTPAFMAATAEEVLVSSLKLDPPHFIVINHQLRSELKGYESFGRDYCRELLQVIHGIYCRVYPSEQSQTLPEEVAIELFSDNPEDCK